MARTGLVSLLWGIAGIIMVIPLVLLNGNSAAQWLVIVLILAGLRFLFAWLITLSVPDTDD